MPGSVSIAEAVAQPTIPADIDFTMCLIGYSTTTPLAANLMSALYASPAAFASDYGIGDAVDAGTQALAITNGNPAPPSIAFYPTPATTPGTMGTTSNTNVTGTAVMSSHSGAAPKGTYQVVGKCVTGGTIGVAGIILKYSLDNGRTYLPQVALGTATTQLVYLPAATPNSTGVQFDFAPASADLTALNTLLNDIKSDFNEHIVLVGGSPVHGSTGAVDNVATADASNGATRLALVNALRTAYIAHIARVSGAPAIHITADVTAADQLAYGAATDDSTVLLLALDLKAKYNLHIVNTSYHTNPDNVSGVTAAAPSMGVLVAGDYFTCATVPPMWAVADLYNASDPTSIVGALAVIAQTSQQVGMIVITEPVLVTDITTISAGLDYAATFGKKWTVIARFRDPTAGEADAAYIAAFQAFIVVHTDNRITFVAGSIWLTDTFRGYVYLRSGLPAVLARIQSCRAVPGQLGERITQHPGWVGRGALENASLVDANGTLIGHDEQLRGGIDGPVGSTGGGLTFYRIPNANLPGTYVSDAPVAYPAGSAILTMMDRRIANGIERVASAVAWQSIQGAAIWDAVTFALDPDIQDGISSKIAAAIRVAYGAPNPEFQNWADLNLVTVNPTVTVSGSRVTITGTIHVRLYGYINTIALTFSATR